MGNRDALAGVEKFKLCVPDAAHNMDAKSRPKQVDAPTPSARRTIGTALIYSWWPRLAVRATRQIASPMLDAQFKHHVALLCFAWSIAADRESNPMRSEMQGNIRCIRRITA